MRVLMLGWEFPPYITGGLGTACFGLTKALDRHGVDVLFVLPKSVDGSVATHVRLLAPGSPGSPAAPPVSPDSSSPASVEAETIASPAAPSVPSSGSAASTFVTPASADQPPLIDVATRRTLEHVEFLHVPARFQSPYGTIIDEHAEARRTTLEAIERSQYPGAVHSADAAAVTDDPLLASLPAEVRRAIDRMIPETSGGGMNADYGGDLIDEVLRYARFCLGTVLHHSFDVIHAHDWLTYPAGLAIAQLTGRPLVVHVHSTEFDRSGEHVNQRIYDIERRGMHGALRVICVSQLTKNVCINRYGVPEKKIEVVYNGVDLEPAKVGITGIRRRDKIVLYFGRITYQKGPEYFIRAAKRVLEVMEDIKFVVAGSGDQATRMIEMAAELGIGHKVLFTGFLRGDDIKRVFAMADLYVMPSVSEPFGIAPLEAISHDVPALISKSSGVSEVLTHALKTDFWDIDDMANKILAVLRHPPLSRTLKHHGRFEVRRLTWDGAATRCEQVYRQVMRQMPG